MPFAERIIDSHATGIAPYELHTVQTSCYYFVCAMVELRAFLPFALSAEGVERDLRLATDRG